MSKKINSACAKCRRAGEKLMLKGEKCFGPKCPLTKRNYPPGMHGPTQKRTKTSGYGKQLREKQKAKRLYGLLERQFANYVTEASSKVGDTSKYLIQYLESRLDNAVYRAGFSKARLSARQLVGHGLMSINGRRVDVPSYRVRVGDVIAVKESAKNKKVFQGLAERLAKIDPPAWIGLSANDLSFKVLNPPAIDEPGFDAKMIIEFYSR